MTRPPSDLDRRNFLQASAALAAGACWPDVLTAAEHPRSQPPARPDKPAKKLAVVTTTYYYLSHAYHICGRFLHGYLRDGKMHYPEFGIAGMYVAQQGPRDLSRSLSKSHAFNLYPSPVGSAHARWRPVGGGRSAADRRARRLSVQREIAKTLSAIRAVPGDRQGLPAFQPQRTGILRQASVVRPQEGLRYGEDGPRDGLSAAGRVELAGDLAPA